MAVFLGPIEGGKYRVLAQLGQGGTADVSLAVARGPSGFNKLVVLKSMKESLRCEPEFADMFMNEARLAARLNHPNIVQTNEVFEQDGLPVIVMEYLEGQSLANIVVRARTWERFSVELHVRVIADVLSGLHYSHELRDFDGSALGVVHRDVSPHNVFVTYDGQVKLLDFGIAKLSGSRVETATGVIKGKLHYMSPEQVSGEPVDRRADIYSIGVMLWEAATGKKMWRNLNDATVMNRIINGQVVRAREAGAVVDPRLEAIIDKALASDPDDRWESAAELQSALENWLELRERVPTSRDLGRVVMELFSDEREEMAHVLEAQLVRVSSMSESELARLEPIELKHEAGLPGATRDASDTTAFGRAKATLVSAFTAALIAVAAVAGWQLFNGAPAAAPATSSPETTSSGPAIVPQVTLRIVAFPATATLSLDGEALSGNPATRSFERRPGERHQLVARATGYVDARRELEFDRDLEVVLTLQPLPAAQSVSSQAAEVASPLPSRLPVRAKAREADPCETPFFYDTRGVKKYKPECL